MRFRRYIGIDYSGADTPTIRLRTLQVLAAKRDGAPKISAPAADSRNWTLLEIARYCPRALESELCLCEQWTTTAKSAFHFEVRDSVAKATYAGLP